MLCVESGHLGVNTYVSTLSLKLETSDGGALSETPFTLLQDTVSYNMICITLLKLRLID